MNADRGVTAGALVGLVVVAIVLVVLGTSWIALFPMAVAAVILGVLLVRGAERRRGT
jgi:uncharacterized membrane protein